MSTQSIGLEPNVLAYLHRASLREPEVLQQLREETSRLEMARMQISPEQGQFMRLLIQVLGARRTLEVGVFTGYSTLSVALALPEGGQVVACDISEEWTAIGRRYWAQAGVADRIELHLAPALETLRGLLAQGQAGRFDFAFIDADKENYLAYYEHCLQLLRPGGVLAVDNVLWGGRVADPQVKDDETVAIRRLNEQVLWDERVDMSLVPIGDGLTLARKR
jgi:caffeoyl-CoA O-methyltransferase